MLRCLNINLKTIGGVKMINNRYKSSLSVDGLDEILHNRFREGYFDENNTLNGVNSKELILAAKRLVQVDTGELEKVELVDPKAALLLTHTNNTDNNRIIGDCNRIMRRNEKQQLRRVSVDRGDYEDVNIIKSHIITKYGTLRRNLAIFLNKAMKMHLRVKNGFIKLVETKKEVDTSFISGDGGQISFIKDNTVVKMFTSLVSKVSSLENEIKELKESSVKSVKDVSSKVRSKVNKGPNSKGKSGKAKAKLDKAERILNNLKKRYKHRFTNKQYREPLAKLTKQGDDRTVRSDLETLEGAGLIRKVRSGAHGEETYKFTNNDLYPLYNNDLGKNRFFDDVKEKFFMDDAFTLVDLNDFIFEKYELFDDESQNKRLKWLTSEGLVTRHPVNPDILLIQK